jgi:glycosyltransferase involved in cell wall biosynthesis
LSRAQDTLPPGRRRESSKRTITRLRRVRVGILTQYYPPEIGAPQSRLSELAARLTVLGHETVVLTALPNYPQGRIYPGYRRFFVREQRGGVTVLRTPIWPTKSVALIPRTASYLSFVVSSLLFGAARLPRIDVLITESPPLPLGVTGFLLSRLKRARWVFNVSDLWPQTAIALGSLGDGRLTRLAYRLEAFCYRRATAVSCQSREIEESINERFPGVRTISFANGTDTDSFSPARRSETFWQDLIGDDRPVAVYAGLHGACQGLDQLIEAAERIQDDHLRLVLVGDGPEKEALVDSSSRRHLRNITFLEPQPKEAMPTLLASADIAVVALRTRLRGAVPSKLYEAMASGLPVVLVAEGEPAEILQSTNAGIAVDPGDIEGIADALRQLAASESEREELGTAARAAAVERFDRRPILDRFIDELKRLSVTRSAAP